MTDIDLPMILFADFLALVSPGPAALAIAGTSMSSGRRVGLAQVSGVTTGSFIWSVPVRLWSGRSNSHKCLGVRGDPLRRSHLPALAGLQIRTLRLALRRICCQRDAPTTTPRTYAKGVAMHLKPPKQCCLFLARSMPLASHLELKPRR